MKPEQLSRGREIQEEIRILEIHKRVINEHLETGNASVYLNSYANQSAVGLKHNLMLIPLEKSMQMYLQNVDTEIAKLEKEFEGL